MMKLLIDALLTLAGRTLSEALADLPDLSDKIVKLDDFYCGAGAYSDVYKCQYDSTAGRVEVAVKSFRFLFTLNETEDDSNRKSAEARKMIRRELGIWRRLDHPNIVPFLGIAYGFGRPGHASLVSLWMPHGTLDKFLEGQDDKLGITDRLRLLLDIANGLCYLHSFPIVHGDLSCNNVLIDQNYRACLADFGFASMVGEIPEASKYLRMTTMRPGTIRWTAPEYLSPDVEQTTQRTTQSDVYSFGNLGFLVLSGEHPWSEVRLDAQVIIQLSRGLKPKRPSSRPIENRHWELIERCWSSVDDRPHADDVVSVLSQFLSSEHRPTTINVVLFGETGVGKSGVINLIARGQLAKASSDVIGCTMQSTRYDIQFDGMNFAIFDTVGLEQPKLAINGYFKAIEKAYQLIEELSAAGGIHLLLFCMRGSRITATTQSNYRLFSEVLCSKSVPIALVFTGLEREVEMEDWWERNEKQIFDYGIKSNGHACVTAVQDDIPGKDLKYTESQRRIREVLKTCALQNGTFSPGSDTWIVRFGRLSRSFIAKHKVAPKEMLRVLTKRCKLDPETAKRIVDMMEKSSAMPEDAQAADTKVEATTDPVENRGDDEHRTDRSDENDGFVMMSPAREGSQTPRGWQNDLPRGIGDDGSMTREYRVYRAQGLDQQVTRPMDGRGRFEQLTANEEDEEQDGPDDEAASGYQTAPQNDIGDELPIGYRGGSQEIQRRREAGPGFGSTLTGLPADHKRWQKFATLSKTPLTSSRPVTVTGYPT